MTRARRPMMSRRLLLRAVDANVNRTREGLRVCEDLVRFCLESRVLFQRMRAIRRALDRHLKQSTFTSVELVRARRSPQDPGRTSVPLLADSVEQLLLINLQRTKESLRVLEESSRVLSPQQAEGFQHLRFQVYHAERTILLFLATLRHPR